MPFTNALAAQMKVLPPAPSDDESSDKSKADAVATEEATGGAPDDINGVSDQDDTTDQDDEDDDIPLSDLDSLPEEEKEDIIPHQRLTINNTAALKNALTSISIPISALPFSEHQS